jgi:hypothetical protein
MAPRVSKKKTFKHNAYVTIVQDIRDYSKDPLIIKRTEEARVVLIRTGVLKKK